MFSPFRDRQGAPKALADVEYADLAQLSSYEEGFALEFKQSFSPGVRTSRPVLDPPFSLGALCSHALSAGVPPPAGGAPVGVPSPRERSFHQGVPPHDGASDAGVVKKGVMAAGIKRAL